MTNVINIVTVSQSSNGRPLVILKIYITDEI